VRSLKFEGDSFEDFLEWGQIDKQVHKKLIRLLQEVRRTPFDGIGKPEPLKGNYAGFWSRRITDEHRLIYEITNNEIIIHSVKGHYE
jgi:toxin YoeB